MGTRNILDKDGNIIGNLTLSDSTTEEQWLISLNSYKESLSIPDVTPRQIRQALILSGINMSDIDSALDNLSEPTRSLAKTEWEYSVAFQRNRPLVAQVAQMLGWTSQQLDDLWKLAGSL